MQLITMKHPRVDFSLDHPQGSSAVFKTNDTITGEVIFTPQQTTSLNNVAISLEGKLKIHCMDVQMLIGVGNMKIEVENMASHLPVPRTKLRRTFLRMELPVHKYALETTFESGRTYQIPFEFVVPSELPMHVCCHSCANPQVQQQHLQLPPSQGHASQYFDAHDGASSQEDVSYRINFTLWQYGHPHKTRPTKKLHEAHQPIYILPRSQERAPILVPHKSRQYRLRAEKALAKGLLRPTLGSLTALATQPPGIEIAQGPRPRKNGDMSTNLRIDLSFRTKNSDQPPPRLLSCKFKLWTMTFYGLDRWQDFPDQINPFHWTSRQTLWSETVSLNSTPALVDWKILPREKLDSGEGTVYSASIDTVVVLPTGYVYLPTFHSCFISRVYSLQVSLVFQSHKARQSTPVRLAVPVQIFAS